MGFRRGFLKKCRQRSSHGAIEERGCAILPWQCRRGRNGTTILRAATAVSKIVAECPPPAMTWPTRGRGHRHRRPHCAMVRATGAPMAMAGRELMRHRATLPGCAWKALTALCDSGPFQKGRRATATCGISACPMGQPPTRFHGLRRLVAQRSGPVSIAGRRLSARPQQIRPLGTRKRLATVAGSTAANGF
jgi:hypothetical protein